MGDCNGYIIQIQRLVFGKKITKPQGYLVLFTKPQGYSVHYVLTN